MYITCKCNNFIGYIAVFTSLSLLVIIIHKDTFIKKTSRASILYAREVFNIQKKSKNHSIIESRRHILSFSPKNCVIPLPCSITRHIFSLSSL